VRAYHGAPLDMRCTGVRAGRKTAMIPIRNVFDRLQRHLKRRAALAGMSLSDERLS